MKPFALPGIVLCAALCRCSPFSGDMAVRVDVPEFPRAWSGAEAWELSWVSATGSGGPFRVMPGVSAELGLPRDGEAAVFCRAVLGGGLSLPYGASWPQGAGAGASLRPSASGGFAASFASRFYEAGRDRCGFDLVRLAAEAESRLDDPWDLDPAALRVAASELRFRVDCLKSAASRSVVVTGLPSTLYPDSPWGEPAVPDSGGAALVSLPPGRVRRWIGGGYELRVSVSSSGAAAWTLSGP